MCTLTLTLALALTLTRLQVILHTDHCAKKLLPWMDGMLAAPERSCTLNPQPYAYPYPWPCP